MNNEIQEYLDSSGDFLRKAKLFLEEGDLHQASEKGWGAAAHMAKAVAYAHGLEYGSHRHFYDAVNHMVDLLGREDIYAWQSSAVQLHDFFYTRKGQLHYGAARYNIDVVESMMDDLKGLVS